MGRPRPIEVHSNSKGKKHLVFQELIHAEEGYAYIPVDGSFKTDLFNKGLLDGRKKAIKFNRSLSECESLWVLVLPLQLFEANLTNKSFVGVISLDRTYLVRMKEAGAFIKNVCMTCEEYGTHNCYLSLSFDCGEDDREQYRDGSHFEFQKEIRRNRKQKAFPV
ncbi:hypothetical protein [Paenibacillus periandrae]|uniref:hypothetical protein n=1 Tax=Paenibacillus periandrae TaxID=1761741 RepID=UPI001F08AC83|nr:hypothetical protein [Paenibacillus periandrae]